MYARRSGTRRKDETDLISEAVAPGTIQVPRSGKPILLLGDCQTIGGYPKIAHVITVDLGIAAQLRAGDGVRFSEVSLQDAIGYYWNASVTWSVPHRPESPEIMKLSIDLNADLGEGSGHDAELFELISSANIATGFHAGDSDTMHAAVSAAKKQGVAVGAHRVF